MLPAATRKLVIAHLSGRERLLGRIKRVGKICLGIVVAIQVTALPGWFPWVALLATTLCALIVWLLFRIPTEEDPAHVHSIHSQAPAIWRRFRDRWIHVGDMDQPLRLITWVAVAQLFASAVLLFFARRPGQPVEVGTYEGQPLNITPLVFRTCVVFLLVAWSFVLAGTSRVRISLLLGLSILTIATRPPLNPKRMFVLWLLFTGVIWCWGLLRLHRNRKASQRVDDLRWPAMLRTMLFLILSLTLYYSMAWVLLHKSSTTTFPHLINDQMFNFSLFLVPVLFLAGADAAAICELGADFASELIARVKFPGALPIITILIASGCLYEGLTTLEDRRTYVLEVVVAVVAVAVIVFIFTSGWALHRFTSRFRSRSRLRPFVSVVLFCLWASFAPIGVLILIGLARYSIPTVMLSLVSFFAWKLMRHAPVTEQGTSTDVPFAALAVFALFLTGAHEAGTLMQAGYQQPLKPGSVLTFSVSNQQYSGERFSISYPSEWQVLPGGDHRSWTYQHDPSGYAGGAFLVTARKAEELHSFSELPINKRLKATAVSIWPSLGSVEQNSTLHTPSGAWELNFTWGNDDFVVYTEKKRLHAWVWEQQTGNTVWILLGLGRERYKVFYADLFGRMLSSWKSDGSTAPLGPMQQHELGKTALRISTFGLWPVLLGPLGLLLLFLPRIRPTHGKSLGRLRQFLFGGRASFGSVPSSFGGPRDKAALFAIAVALCAFLFFPIGRLTELTGHIQVTEHPLAAMELWVAVASILGVPFLVWRRAGRNSSQFKQIMHLNFGLFFLSVFYWVYTQAIEVSQRRVLAQAVVLVVVLLWDLLMSGKEITNVDGPVFRRPFRVLLYLGYLMLVSSAILYFSSALSAKSNKSIENELFEAENIVRHGIVWLGAPLLFLGFALRIANVKHLLFICSGNINRSPTAESLFLGSRFYEAKSAGTDQNAVVKVSQGLIDWADVVFVMSEKEDGHLTFIENNFSVKDKLVCDLDIPDNYDTGDPELIGLLKERIEEFMHLQGYPVERESTG